VGRVLLPGPRARPARGPGESRDLADLHPARGEVRDPARRGLVPHRGHGSDAGGGGRARARARRGRARHRADHLQRRGAPRGLRADVLSRRPHPLHHATQAPARRLVIDGAVATDDLTSVDALLARIASPGVLAGGGAAASLTAAAAAALVSMVAAVAA